LIESCDSMKGHYILSEPGDKLDGIHPTAEGHALIARDLLGDLNPECRERPFSD